MKTVLAPGAPWPTYEPKVEARKPKPKPKKKIVVTPRATKIKNTTKNFELWLEKNL